MGVRVLPGDSNENKPAVGAEEEEVAKMGCPSLGEHTQLEVIIEESYEFKVRLHKHDTECAREREPRWTGAFSRWSSVSARVGG